MNLKFLALLVFFCLAVTAARAQFSEHILSTQTGQTFNYTVYNDEPSGSPYYIDSFAFFVDGPLSSVSAPTNWEFYSDYATYVEFFNIDLALPYPDDIAPGASLSGFSIQSPTTLSDTEQAFVLSWDHTNDISGPFDTTTVLVPDGYGIGLAPESSSFISFTMLLTIGGIIAIFTRKRSRQG